ncbi:ABC transporter permease [Clostridiales bacterium PH28_bin88]|nr:ABC transporter permease [Clostridiales bacterium PH28_bin88]
MVLSFSTPAFLTARNLQNIVDQSAAVGIIACAMTLAIISGNFDLSAGAIFAFAGSLAAIIAASGYVELGFAAGVLTGLVLGLINGAIISGFRVHSFIATLATGLIIRGLAMILTGGRLIIVNDHAFKVMGQGTFLGIKYPIFILAAWVTFTWILLSRTTFGRAVYAIGGNAEAARLSGIQVNWVRTLIFGLTGLSAALAGVITVSRIGQGQADIGSTVDLEAIARVVIGGTRIMGGEGAIWRTVFGVLLMRLMSNGFNILNVPPFYQRVFEGTVILFAVAVDTLTRSRRQN